MVSKTLLRGMGAFFKECSHPESRWSKCPHPYKIRYRNVAGKQTVESGFVNQDNAIERLVEMYKARKGAPRSQSKAERIQKYGSVRFEEYTAEWKTGQRDLAASSMRHLDSLLSNHVLPALGSRRMDSFDHKVVDRFIQAMERNGVGLATQANAYDKLKAIILDAHRLGIFEENPLEGVKPPQYDSARAVIPSVVQLQEIRSVGEYRDVPLPARIKETIEWYAGRHGTTDGYLLKHPVDPARTFTYYYLSNQWQRIKRSEEIDIPEGMVMYGFRHFFASNCLSKRIPITDVAEWMGHNSIDVTFKIYRHLMPGSIGRAAKLLDVGLTA